MRVSVLGGSEAGATSILVEDNRGRAILVDFGLKVFEDDEIVPKKFPVELKNLVNRIEAVFITHAHLDHVGALPYLLKWGYSGPIYSTEPTRPLVKRVLLNSVKVLGENSAYSVKDVLETRKGMKALKFFEEINVGDFTVSFYSSEHIIGSAMVLIRGEKTILITSDFKWEKSMLHYGVQSKIAGSLLYEEFERCDLMIMESSYGNREVVNFKDLLKILSNKINKTVKRKGKVLIVTGAINKPGEIALMIDKCKKEGLIPWNLEVYIDGLAAKLYDTLITFRKFTRVKNARVLSKAVKKVDSITREKLVEENEPCVIISSGEYLSGITSLFYFKKIAPSEKNAVIFATTNIPEGTLAYNVVRGERLLEMGGSKVEVKAEVSILPLSLHSDKRGLLQFARLVKPKRILLIHGSRESKEALAKHLHAYNPIISSENMRLKL
ncbi:MAG: hypothetical protein DRN04_00665 [Thermoprotei archaeon]|nr:MAG: hypothetical protein DRN04_00665 [Thermoprotei archaeon]